MSDSDAHGLLALLPDAHAHPQLDVDHLERAARLRIPCVAAMGVAANVDWAGVARLAALQGVWVQGLPADAMGCQVLRPACARKRHCGGQGQQARAACARDTVHVS